MIAQEDTVEKLDLQDVEGAFGTTFGLPRPDWGRIGARIASLFPQGEIEAAWTEAARQWLATLRDALGAGYAVVESRSFLLLAPLGEQQARELLLVGERTLSWLQDVLSGLAVSGARGKLACIALATEDAYYDYVSHFYDEGEWGASGGMFLGSDGYAHFALNSGDLRGLEPTFVHELAHALLVARWLPRWLDEAIAQLVEEDVFGQSRLHMDRREARRHHRFWRRHGLDGFWRGETFSRTRSMPLSYGLALIIARNMLSRGRERFVAFLGSASALDAGEAASREVYGLGVGEWASHFLGPGDWAPPAATGLDHLDHAFHRLDLGDHEGARRSLQKALDLSPDDPAVLNHAAWILATCPAEAIRDGARAVALANRACEITGWKSEPEIDILAAACAEAGDFDAAVRHAETALALATGDARKGAEERLELYRGGKPYRDASFLRCQPPLAARACRPL